jgi:hypothetical protein
LRTWKNGANGIGGNVTQERKQGGDGLNELRYDLSFAEYQARDGINASAIAHGRKSMLHMHHAMTRTTDDATAAMAFGTLAHYVVLEGGGEMVTCDARRGTNAWKAAVEEVGDERLLCKPADFEAAMAMRDAVMRNSEAAWIIDQTKHEASGFWSGAYGLAKMRADMLSDVILADYKTTGDITPDRFFATAERLAYHVKMGWYAEGVEAITGKRPRVLIIVQEQREPHDCWVCEIPQSTIDQGREEAVEIARRYRTHEAVNSFPGVVEAGVVVPYERPSWVLGGKDAEVNMEGMDDE